MTELCSIHDIQESNSKGFDSPHGAIFVVKKDDQIFVYKNECPHLGVNLEFQEDVFLDQDGALIECSTHGALFEIESGNCLAGPCQGEHLTAIPFKIENDLIHV
ncbi:Rieske (2Fe-2S) protein [Reinekea marina]|uniref:Rieske (2Fe-2S) protein n=1 Tax=Reinekea marina TaxID=1310421 RepID=A0ABV7WTE8_9GAMM|nr:Rieske (2Fe-2S) protein [Reinekea marina]MDN3650400.1 Rieske (2Fe-2S) protein [Reinekea marina]